jgi:pyruvate dehydrogenase E2 component (dihydrolipoamide acetyltransferase)
MTDAATQTTGKGSAEVAKLSLPRRAMVRAMVESAAVPTFYLRVTADVTELVAARQALRGDAEWAGRVPTLNDFVMRAAALALREHPQINSAFADGEVATFARVNVGVAIAVPGGLVAPAIYDADAKDVGAIAADVRELADLAAARRLSKDVLADATFTVSNLGMFGIEDFDPILNPPQAAILGVGAAMAGGAAAKRVAAAAGASRPSTAERRTMRLTLGCDHRVLTGAEAAPFLLAVRDRLQDPEELRPASTRVQGTQPPGGETPWA